MKIFTKILIALILLAGIVFTGVQVVQAAEVSEKPAYSTAEAFCLSYGGIWVGVNVFRGVCTFSPGSAGHAFIGLCTQDQNTIATFVSSVRTDSCEDSLPATPAPVGPGYGKCGNEAGKTDEAVILNTCQGVSVAFDAGSCTGKCTVGPKVLGTAKKGLSQLGGEVLGEAYVKVRNPDGGSYTICIPGEGTIYKWVSGAWVAQTTQTVNGVSCAWSSGDGNYVLVAND